LLTLLANEWTKLRTVRGPWLLLAAGQVVVVAGVSGLAAAGSDPRTDSGVRALLSHAGVASALFALVLGITAVAGEYRHRTITDTYLSTPGRTRVVLAKLLAYTGLGLVAGVVSAANGALVTAAWAAADGGGLDLSDPSVWRILVGVVAYNTAYAAIGVSLGALVRNQTAAIAVALIWIILVESALANLLADVGRWLPNRAGMGVGYMPAAGVLPQWGAGLLLAGYAIAFVAAAAATTVRRDVT
jgi:ABC-2 type transport system permease protein